MVDAGAEGVAVVADRPYTGTCLCGAVSYRAVGLTDIWYCHCNQCQKLTGLYVAAAGVKRENLEIKGDVNWLPISNNRTQVIAELAGVICSGMRIVLIPSVFWQVPLMIPMGF